MPAGLPFRKHLEMFSLLRSPYLIATWLFLCAVVICFGFVLVAFLLFFLLFPHSLSSVGVSRCIR